MGIFPDAQGQLTPQSKVKSALFSNTIRDFMVVLDTCKNEEDPTKNERVKVVTTFSINFQDAQGQLTP